MNVPIGRRTSCTTRAFFIGGMKADIHSGRLDVGEILILVAHLATENLRVPGRRSMNVQNEEDHGSSTLWAQHATRMGLNAARQSRIEEDARLSRWATTFVPGRAAPPGPPCGMTVSAVIGSPQAEHDTRA